MQPATTIAIPRMIFRIAGEFRGATLQSGFRECNEV